MGGRVTATRRVTKAVGAQEPTPHNAARPSATCAGGRCTVVHEAQPAGAPGDAAQAITRGPDAAGSARLGFAEEAEGVFWTAWIDAALGARHAEAVEDGVAVHAEGAGRYGNAPVRAGDR